MKQMSVLLCAALMSVGAARVAQATVYNIQFTSVCDAFKLKVANNLVSGFSNGKQSNGAACDNSFLTGTRAKLATAISPGGAVLVAAGDLGLAPNQYVFYFNMNVGEATLYGTADGKTTTLYGPFAFTVTTGNVPPAARPNMPSLTSTMQSLAKPN